MWWRALALVLSAFPFPHAHRVLAASAVPAVAAPMVRAFPSSRYAVSGYRPPTERPVLAPYHLPSGYYGAGNRGIDYATVAGDPVGAIGPGVVVFAGQVAGRWVVSVAHPDGLRSTYTGVRGDGGAVLVTGGTAVGVGTLLALAGGPFHLGVLSGGDYMDPALLFSGPRRSILIPRG